LVAGLVCLLIAEHRHVKQTTRRAMPVAVLGPAVRSVLVARPDDFSQR